MKRLLSILMMIASLSAYSQNETTKTYESRLFAGVGSADVMDTYLSPYSYTGTRIDVLTEKQYTHTMHRFSVHSSFMENMAGNVDEYDFGFSYGLAHHFGVLSNGKFTLKVGPMGYLNLGCIYNERNGNNPAQAKVSLMADASALAKYNFNLWNKQFAVEYSLDVPVVGLAYSPQYGQSYYEEFVLGHSDHNCVFAYVGNTPSIRQRLLLDFPFLKTRFYVGYNGLIEQSTYNHLRYHSYSHSFVIGIKL